jgi:APA family basic amino acid/polyamine antiporter
MDPAVGPGLIRAVRRWDLLALVLNTIVGAGILGLPSRVYALAGSYSLVAYLVCAIPVVLIILCFAEVGSRFRQTGGPYLYARTAFGPFVGFEVGWLLWLARAAGFAALCNLFVGYLSYFIPVAGSGGWRALVILMVVSLLTAINVAGVRATTRMNNFLTLGKLIPLVLFAGAGLFFVDPQRYDFLTEPSYSAFSQAALLLVFAYTGFEVAIIAAGETRNPQRDAPFALLAGIGLVVILYVLIQTVCIGTLAGLARSERPLADASVRFLGAAGAVIVSLGALLSLAGTMNATLFAIPRVLFAMAEQRQLPRSFLITHPRFHTPHVAILASAGVMLALTLFSTFISALTISTLIRLLVYMTTCAALPVLRRNHGAPRAAFSMPAGTLIAILACLLSIWLLSNGTRIEAMLVALASVTGALLYIPSMMYRNLTDPVAGV